MMPTGRESVPSVSESNQPSRSEGQTQVYQLFPGFRSPSDQPITFVCYNRQSAGLTSLPCRLREIESMENYCVTLDVVDLLRVGKQYPKLIDLGPPDIYEEALAGIKSRIDYDDFV